MLSNAETPRPLPPAKARRATMLKLSSTPPPAYNSAFTFPSRRQSRQDILDHIIGWDGDSVQSSSSPPLREKLDWMKDKSREELEELLVTADDLIKERKYGFCVSFHFIGLMTYPFFFVLQHSISARQRPRTCIRILRLSSRTMTYLTSCCPKFPA